MAFLAEQKPPPQKSFKQPTQRKETNHWSIATGRQSYSSPKVNQTGGGYPFEQDPCSICTEELSSNLKTLKLKCNHRFHKKVGLMKILKDILDTLQTSLCLYNVYAVICF